MDYSDTCDMPEPETTSQCVVHDKTPGSEQTKINIVVRRTYTVDKVFKDISTQYNYKDFELVLQPLLGQGDLIYLNGCKDKLIYDVHGYLPDTRNTLILLPTGEWDGNVKKRYDLLIRKVKKIASSNKNTAAIIVSQNNNINENNHKNQNIHNDHNNIVSKMNTDSAVPTTVVASITAPIAVTVAAPPPKTLPTPATLTPAKATPAKSTPEKATSAKSTPAKPTTAKSTPAKSTPAKPTTAIPTSVEPTPAIPTPVVPTPAKTTPALSPMVPTPALAIPTPAKTTPAPSPVVPTPVIPAPIALTQPTVASNTNTTTVTTTTANIPAATEDSSLNLSPMSDTDHDQLSDDDLALGASASPTETEPMNGGGGLSLAYSSPGNNSRVKFGPMYEEDRTYERSYESLTENKSKYPLETLPSASSTAVSTGANGYVGLVNQAMTCYLNSLLQALYMTPEFRNALYRWEFDNDNESKNIPYQLQKLFLNLQTSKKSAVETTDLTRSFGWDSTEAWQQHDIQELCRVMFDALEHKFKNTKQAHLISNLYEGKMIDYVKCLECQTEKTRDDTFLDIPLPVRPFGSSIAYGSIEEALRAFVQPETLDGNNQYFCEKCNKKCDAHKGLKFKNFPYVLTLHLKRFDFDYSTMHRIKLNDKVTFPQALNLNSFVNATDAEMNGTATSSAAAAAATSTTTTNGFVLNGVVGPTATTTDDCSTTDSGSAMEEDNCSSGIATTASSSQHENDMNDEDEGIDMSTSTDHRINGNSANVQQRLQHEAGPYMYELFAIMIHSGSASGGHYYAYIKEFENNEWYCFNDQTVSPITEEDIERSFGGGNGTKPYYTSVYSSSTNAYMLMYRQIDPKRNERITQVHNELPAHIQTLLPKLHAEEETRGSGRTSGSSRYNSLVTDLALPEVIKPRVYFYNSQLKKLKMARVYVSRSFDINSVLESAYQRLNVEDFAPLSRCRVVGYDQSSEEILMSFENVTDPSLADIRASCDGTLDYLLEYRAEGQEFEVYEPGGTTWSVFMVNLATMEMDGPYFVYSAAHECNDVLRHSIAVRLHLREHELLLATLRSHKAFVAYDPTPTKEAQEHLQEVASAQFRNLMYFYLNVPSLEESVLEMLGIPSYEVTAPAPAIEVSSDVVDAVRMNGNSTASASSHSIGDAVSTHNGSSNSNSPLPPPHVFNGGHESNSEDSSLSDGDRTLVESIKHRGGGDSQLSSAGSDSPQGYHSPQLSSPEDEATRDSINRVHAFFNGNGHSAAVDNNIEATSLAHYRSVTQFFHAIKIDCIDPSTTAATVSAADNASEDPARKTVYAYKILVDSHMKMETFKRHIESLIRVPANYFQIHRKHETSDPISPTNALMFINEGETLLVGLGKVLQPDELRTKIYFMRLSEFDNDIGTLPCACEWIYTASMTVAEAKKALIARLQRIDTKFQSLTLDNCRLWLKGGRNPIKILEDDETLGNDMRSSSILTEFVVQECEDGIKPQTSSDSLTLFVRRWHADKLQLDNFQEITLEKDGEIRNALSKISDLPEEHIAYSKINGSFPCTNISLLSVNSSMSWFSIPGTLDKYPLTTSLTGNVYFYKDVTKAPKELSPKERRNISIKEKTRLDQLGCSSMSTSLYSNRRERALKIYLDSPQTTTTASAPMDASSAQAATDD